MGWTVRGWNPSGAKFSAPIQTNPGAHPAFYTVGTRSFPGVKWPGCDVNHPPYSGAEAIEKVELYLYSFSGPSWPVLGQILSLAQSNKILSTKSCQMLITTLMKPAFACKLYLLYWLKYETFHSTDMLRKTGISHIVTSASRNPANLCSQDCSFPTHQDMWKCKSST
jgi:hypothetical protein